MTWVVVCFFIQNFFLKTLCANGPRQFKPVLFRGQLYKKFGRLETVRNRLKGLDLIDRVPDELWTEVHDTVEETGIKTIPKKKKCKNTNI